jgi:hypothetical protein
MAGLIKGQGTISVGDLERLFAKLDLGQAEYVEVLQDVRHDNHRRGFWTTGAAGRMPKMSDCWSLWKNLPRSYAPWMSR